MPKRSWGGIVEGLARIPGGKLGDGCCCVFPNVVHDAACVALGTRELLPVDCVRG